MKNNIIIEYLFPKLNRYLPNWFIWLTKHLPQDMLHILVLIYWVTTHYVVVGT